jgi:hypothetical protein
MLEILTQFTTIQEKILPNYTFLKKWSSKLPTIMKISTSLLDVIFLCRGKYLFGGKILLLSLKALL